MESRPVPRQSSFPSAPGKKPVKPAADITVWGIVLLLAGQSLAAIPTFAGGGLSAGWGWAGMDPFLMIGTMFIGAALMLAGLIMLLMGVHRIISRNDPPPLPLYDPEKQNPDGTYKNAFATDRDGGSRLEE